MSPSSARIVFALVAIAAALTAAPPALAGQASVQGSTVVYTDTPGVGRALTWARDGSAIAVSEAARDIGQKVVPSAGPGCVVDQRNDFSATYVCNVGPGADLRLDLGDGDDTAEPAGTSAFSPPRYFQDLAVPVTVLGGDGNDEITGGPLADSLDGGPGNDSLFASVDARGGGGDASDVADTMTGGPGNDTISGGKSIDAGDGDDIVYGSLAGSTIAGGPGKDTLQGGRGPDVIDGGDGPDSIDSASGDDKVAGGEGDDTIDAGEGNDTIDGGGGADTIDARAGDDAVGGGDGPDHLEGGPGRDTFSAGAGDDVIDAADGGPDSIDCGAGIDTVTGWDSGKDVASPRESCEKVPEGGLDARHSRVLGYATAPRTGRLKVRFRCVNCQALTVALVTWQFWDVPRKPGLAIGSGCPQGKSVKLKRTTLDQFDGTLKLTTCQRRTLRSVVALERRGKAKLRRFTFSFRTAGHTIGQVDTGGKR